ncbi:SusC/RagA family TonB-linked outer membrane protein [uncultured Draconibacterium sp.]|uniref:SusC/RagA family TonB-linked outer membrane protein n=1 Tax=uncultured Draconibacterium sp. TaxID=1573823 RepID=UPI0025DC0C91|nr:SusC/RagA family TonB-linked outer membrane protein [uncultured Draconibacterium sp.]
MIFLLSGFAVMAQQGKVTGKVTDESDAPLPGVTVVVKGTSNGTTTNFDGEYTLQNVSEGDVVVFSFIGMITQEVAFTGQATANVKLLSDTQNLDEVVVTALGIQRDKKTLTYSSQQVTGDEIMKARDVNFMSGLNGKTAGLEIRKSTSGAGGSTRTVLRGSKSIRQVSDPLYVIDGIPMVNNKGGQSGMWGGTDQGDGLSQLNPDDIESISVLKGATAAVLYGSDGANGVIIISTKKGKQGKTNVTFSSTATFENIIETPDMQFSYGGENGSAESWSYTKGNYANGYVDDFFETGYNLINTVTVSGGSEKMSTYFSYGNTGSGGVVPNNSYQKNNVTFKQSLQLLDNLKITSNVMLTSEKTKNRATAGYYLNPITSLYTFPRDLDFADYKENYQYFREDRNMYWQNWFVEGDHFTSNPYWLINKQPKEDLTKRVIASLALDYQISEKLKFQARGSIDYANKKYEQKYYAGGNKVNISPNGRWDYQKYEDKQVYADGIFTYSDNFGDVSLNVIAGATYQESEFRNGVSVNNGTNSLIYPNEFYFQNIPDNVSINSTYGGKIIKQGVLGNVQLGYKDMLFLDLSGRNDWSSTLALTGNQSYFYPSVGVSGILTEMFEMPEAVSFAKVRLSGSQVNNEVPWGLIQVNHSINASGGVSRNTGKPFTDAKPEELVTLEFGTDWRLFDGRLGLDFTYYHITSTNQALSRPLSGGQQDNYYTYEYFNAGEIVNKGVEVVLSGKPVESKDFNWNTVLNFSKNNNEVVELYPDDETKYIDLGSSEGYYARVFTGGSIGDIYGYKLKRNEAGQIMLDDNGKPLRTPSEITYANKDEAYLGSLEPDFSLGWSNNFNYKQFNLSFLINAKIGGKAYSQTESILDGWGVSQRTADARDQGYVSVDAIQGTTAVTELDPKTYYTSVGGRNGVSELYVYDRTNIRLTQLALSYDLDVQRIGLPVKSASIALVGQNLFFFYKKAPFDPELGMSTDMNSQSLDNFSVPATRSYGFNLKFTF